MSSERFSFKSDIGANAGFIVDRKPQTLGRAVLPADLQLVSADNHLEVTEDVFYEAFASHLRDAAPKR